jgi:hypothetical protein
MVDAARGHRMELRVLQEGYCFSASVDLQFPAQRAWARHLEVRMGEGVERAGNGP